MKNILSDIICKSFFVIGVIFNLFIGQIQGQQVIEIIPLTSSFLTTENIWSFSIVNSELANTQYAVKIEVYIEDQIPVLEVISPHFTLPPGIKSDFSDIKIPSNYKYFPNEPSDEFQSKGMLSYQKAQLCVTLYKSPEFSILTKVCENFVSNQVIALHLAFPEDNSEIETLNPLLQWIPMNVPQSSIYKIRLCEILNNQEKEIALALNPPLLITDIPEMLLLYPLEASALEFGKQYVWHVEAYNHSKMVAQSEIWKFTPLTRLLTKDESDCYRIISKKVNNDNYLYGNKIKFTYDNRSNEEILNYTIKDLLTNTELKSLPKISLNNGLNKIIIDLEQVKGMKKEARYILSIKNSKRESYLLTFKMNESTQ